MASVLLMLRRPAHYRRFGKICCPQLQGRKPNTIHTSILLYWDTGWVRATRLHGTTAHKTTSFWIDSSIGHREGDQERNCTVPQSARVPQCSPNTAVSKYSVRLGPLSSLSSTHTSQRPGYHFVFPSSGDQKMEAKQACSSREGLISEAWRMTMDSPTQKTLPFKAQWLLYVPSV